MKIWQKGFVVAIIHVLIVLTLGGKLLYDRANRPRIWVRTASVDPDLPIRGRYFTLRLEVQAPDFQVTERAQANPSISVIKPKQPIPQYFNEDVQLEVVNGQLLARKTDQRTGNTVQWWPRLQGHEGFLLYPSVAFFVPEHSETPRLNAGDELWAEVTIPRKGPPRPIQLAVKRGTRWTPLNYR
jgi:uncharacterized membrane-anchored protein